MKIAVTTAFLAGLLNSANAQCDPLPTIGEYLDVTYTSNPGNIEAIFAEDPSSPYQIGLTFDYATYAPTWAEDGSEFAAIVFAGPECGGSNEIIATYNDPIMAAAYVTDYGSIFGLTVDGDKWEPVLKMTADFTNWRPPFYTQSFDCSDSVGIGAPEAGANPTDQTCGVLEFCVEFQVKLCGKKIDFVDVGVEIELDIETNCETDCVDVTLKRAMQAGAEADASAEYPVQCYACEMAPHNCANSPESCPDAYEITQGTPMEVCIALNPDVEGACIVEIESLMFEININGVYGEFQILPTCVFPQCLFPALDGVNMNPEFDIDAVSVGFQPPAWVFQEVTPGSSLEASFKGTVILGFGCYCIDDPSDAGHCDNVVRGRKLQSNNVLAMSTFSTPADITVGGEAPAGGCSMGALFS